MAFIRPIIKGGGTDVSDTTAVASDVLAGEDFYLANGTKTTGTIPTYAGDTEITENATLETEGKYLASDIVVNVSGGGASYKIRTAELPNTTIKLYNESSTLLDTKTTDATLGGYVIFDIETSGTYTINAYDSNETLLWTNTVIVTDIGLYNCKTGKAFADYAPAEVNTASKNHYAKYMWSVGDSRNITTLGSSKNWVIMGFEHDNLSDGSGKAGITMGMHSYTDSSYKHNNTNDNKIGWEGSLIRQNCLKSGDVYYTIDTTVTSETIGTYYVYNSTTNVWDTKTLPTDYNASDKYYTITTLASDGAFVSGIPDWNSYFVQVLKETADAGMGYSKIIKSKDTVFLFSDVEVFGNSNRYSRYSQYELEGIQYDYFKNDFSDGKVRPGSACWLRSPYSGSATGFCYIGNGGYVDNGYASGAGYARLGFCL